MVSKVLSAAAVLLLAAVCSGQFRPSQQFRGQQQFRPRQQFRQPQPQRRPQPPRQGRVISRPSSFPQQQQNSFSRPSSNSRPQARPSNTRPQPQTSNRAPAPLSQPSSVAQSSSSRPRGKVITIPLPKDASGNDVYPDCNRGKVCLPEAQQCSVRQQKSGSTTYQDKTYWFSWQSDEQVLKSGSWNWFTARNYCRKRCMDLVAFETEAEWSLVKNFMSGAGIKEIWTSGRLCDSEVSGCEAEHYQPLNINGWFWASTLIKMLPTNRPVGLNPDGVRVIGVNEWAKTGAKGQPQPDGFTPEGGLGEEPCMAVINGTWHDTSCHNRRAIVCEDLPAQNIEFVRNENPGIRIP